MRVKCTQRLNDNNDDNDDNNNNDGDDDEDNSCCHYVPAKRGRGTGCMSTG